MVWELRHPRPVLDVRRFTERRFAGSNLAVALFFLAVFGAFYYLTQHLQFVLGYNALDTGCACCRWPAPSSSARRSPATSRRASA